MPGNYVVDFILLALFKREDYRVTDRFGSKLFCNCLFPEIAYNYDMIVEITIEKDTLAAKVFNEYIAGKEGCQEAGWRLPIICLPGFLNHNY